RDVGGRRGGGERRLRRRRRRRGLVARLARRLQRLVRRLRAHHHGRLQPPADVLLQRQLVLGEHHRRVGRRGRGRGADASASTSGGGRHLRLQLLGGHVDGAGNGGVLWLRRGCRLRGRHRGALFAAGPLGGGLLSGRRLARGRREQQIGRAHV